MPGKSGYRLCRDKHRFGKITSRGITIQDKTVNRGVERGYQECQNKLCPKVVELKRIVYVDRAGRVAAHGKWQEDTKFDPNT